MAFAKIPLNFATMAAAYRDHKSLPADIHNWVTKQNEAEDKVNEENKKRKEEGLKPLPGGGHSTTCCMQVSLSFNATRHPIPKEGPRSDRNNMNLSGKYYVLTVNEFRAYLTYKYGPTDSPSSTAEIKGREGLVLYGGDHIEMWDGEFIFQSADGVKNRKAKKYVANPGAVMGAKILAVRPLYFWEIGDAPATPAVPEWVVGWWWVHDGNDYYYYFFPNGNVCWIDVRPNVKWKPPPSTGNHGKVTMIPHGLSILWNPTEPGIPGTKEDFTQLGWTDEEKMNGVSNKYSPLFATKMKGG